MRKQKFHAGDLVHIAKDLGPSMSHFDADLDAVVLGSYADEYGGANTEDYGLYVKGVGPVAWYHEHQLTLLSGDGVAALREWTRGRKRIATVLHVV